MSDNPRVTLQNLECAKAEVERWDNAWANDSSNNPNKFHTQRVNARKRVDELAEALKAQGDIERTPQEELFAKLDAIAPNANSGVIVEFEGHKYRRIYWPKGKSRSGKSVKHWGKGWELEP
ncbi:MAG: hypothetical protein K2P70_01780 [Hyphomonadaceae bacterium]|nr:hypothetical protein [Hyphomonadaceae bacterium]